MTRLVFAGRIRIGIGAYGPRAHVTAEGQLAYACDTAARGGWTP